MMSDGTYRSQVSSQQQQQQQMAGQYMQQSQMQIQPPPASFSHQPQQLLAGGPPPQQPVAMQSQPPYGGMQGIPQAQLHGAGGPSTNLPPPHQGSVGGGASQSGGGVGGTTGGGGGQTTSDNNFHPVLRAKTLMVDLKHALQVLMKTAADATKDQALNENATSAGDAPAAAPTTDTEELRRSLDFFDSICDQVETNFMVMQDLQREQTASDRYTPANVLLGGQKTGDDAAQQPDTPPGRPTLAYREYDDLARIQARFATSIRESFAECSRFLE